MTTFNDITNITHMYFFTASLIFQSKNVNCGVWCKWKTLNKHFLKILTFYITYSRLRQLILFLKFSWILNYINHNWNRCVNDGLVIKVLSNMRFVYMYKQFRKPESWVFITSTVLFKLIFIYQLMNFAAYNNRINKNFTWK